MKLNPGTYQTQGLIESGFLQIGDGYRAKNSELSTDGIPFARAGNINDGFKFEDADMFPVEDLSKVGEKKSRVFDSVFTSKGTVGRIAFVKEGTQEFVYSPQLCYWRSLDHNSISPRFLNYWMNGTEFTNQVAYLKGQTDMADYVSLRDQRKMTITIPDFDIQNQIAKILGDIDDKIELNRQINQTLEHIAQAIFKSWFVDFEPVKAKVIAREKGGNELAQSLAAQAIISGAVTLEQLENMEAGYLGLEHELHPLVTSHFPDQHGLDYWTPETLDQLAALFPDELEDTVHGQIPVGWLQKPLYETAEFINGTAFKSKDFSLSGDGLPIVKITELKSGITAQTKFTIGKFPERYLIGDDEVLYSWSGSPNTSLEVFKWFGGEGWLNQHIFRVITETLASKYFVFFLLRQLKPRLIAIATDKQTTGLGHVTVADMKRLHVPYPTEGLLEYFDHVIGPLYEAASIHEKQLINLGEIRDALLPKLLSSEIKVSGSPAVPEAMA